MLDESVPAGLRRHLPNHTVSTVSESGWSGMKNGALLAKAASHFDAFVTVDKNIQHQQNLSHFPIAVVVLDTPSNALNALLPLIPGLTQALARLTPCTLTRIT
ncbi:hypothetical protein D0T23_21665 [Duganella sp. BJB475]|nr:hypothetical protein D0T23_21665 [Duganella sp. BJB475]RFP27403.1 hypothetical protein D0T21_25575 [Duganella sp. BJB476]